MTFCSAPCSSAAAVDGFSTPCVLASRASAYALSAVFFQCPRVAWLGVRVRTRVLAVCAVAHYPRFSVLDGASRPLHYRISRGLPASASALVYFMHPFFVFPVAVSLLKLFLRIFINFGIRVTHAEREG